MNNYTTEDFSPIFGPDEKPALPGWYCSPLFRGQVEEVHELSGSCYYVAEEFMGLSNGVGFRWWDGSQWQDYPDGGVCEQNRYWFGLNKEPGGREYFKLMDGMTVQTIPNKEP